MERPGTLVTKMDAHLDVPDGGSDGRWSGHEIRYLKVLIAIDANGLHEIATWISAHPVLGTFAT